LARNERIRRRDDGIVERYSEGETMQAIADEVGVSRARIQQVLAARGEVVATALETRKRRRADKRSTKAEKFWREHGATVAALADQGRSKRQIVDRFALLFPELEQATIQTALDRSGITFSKPTDPRHFPDAVLELGVWYVLGLHLQLDPDRGAALASMDFEEASELRDALGQRGFQAMKSPRSSPSLSRHVSSRLRLHVLSRRRSTTNSVHRLSPPSEMTKAFIRGRPTHRR
jgi:hypothetical protein